MRNIIYYPSILIPSDWIKRTIFLSDSISSIYPYRNMTIKGEREEQAFLDMMYLKANGMYEFTRPEDINSIAFKDIFNDLKSCIDSVSVSVIRKKYIQNRTSYQIYKSKMDGEIIRYFLDNKIAHYDEHYSDSIFVEENVGLLYMSLLAFYAGNDNGKYVTSTDEKHHHSRIFSSEDSSSQDKYLNLILKEMPQPSPNASIEDIIKFKEKRRDELLDFRLYITSWIERIKEDKTPFSINTFRDEFERYSSDISSMMSKSGIGVVKTAFEVYLPLLTGIAVEQQMNVLDANALPSTFASATVATVICGVKASFGASKKRKSNPTSYINYAKKEHIL